MDTQSPATGRAKIPIESLRQYDGQWVAFSEDGNRIIAAAEDLAQLDQLVVAAGEDPERIGIDHIVIGRFLFGRS